METKRGKNQYLIEAGNPKLMKRPVKNGTEYVLYLVYYYGYNRENGTPIQKKEKLSLTLTATPRTPLQRQQNKETIELAKKIRFEREQQFIEDKEGYRLKKQTETNFYVFFQNYIDSYTKADIRVIEMALRAFKSFIAEEYPQYKARIEPQHINKDMMIKFADFITDTHKGQGAATVWGRFKKVINYAVEHGVFKQTPCKGVSIPVCDDVLVKDILSKDELITLFNTHYEKENAEVRRAFALTCFAGLRFCDVQKLTYNNIDYENKILNFRQSKTAGHSAKSGVMIPLNDQLLGIIGEKPAEANGETRVFNLPTQDGCNKVLRSWCKRANIDKHITWHCGRHSFATGLLTNGANIKVVAELLGHSKLKYVEVYVRAIDEAKADAINSLPTINIKNI